MSDPDILATAGLKKLLNKQYIMEESSLIVIGEKKFCGKAEN